MSKLMERMHVRRSRSIDTPLRQIDEAISRDLSISMFVAVNFVNFASPVKRRSRPYGICLERLPVKWTSAALFACLGMRRVMMFWHTQ
jgi:hypothetical protein